MRLRAASWLRMIGFSGTLILAGVAWAECDSSQTSKPSTSRFVVKGDAVYDKKTDLYWARCTEGQRWKEDVGCVGIRKTFTYDQANQTWANGWRLPNLDELKTIVAKNCKNPAIDEEIFPDTPSEWYRTSDRSSSGSFCWNVNFGDGRVAYGLSHYCGSVLAVRLVRSGQ